MNRYDFLGWVIVGGVLAVLFFLLVVWAMSDTEQTNKLCFDVMNQSENYDFWTNSSYYSYQELYERSKTYFNCCWNEIRKNEEGYYSTQQCKGFIKEVEDEVER